MNEHGCTLGHNGDHAKHRTTTHPPESGARRRDVGASGLDQAIPLHYAANTPVSRASDSHKPADRREVNNPRALIDSIVNREPGKGHKLTRSWRDWRPRRRDPSVARNTRLVADVQRQCNYIVRL